VLRSALLSLTHQLCALCAAFGLGIRHCLGAGFLRLGHQLSGVHSGLSFSLPGLLLCLRHRFDCFQRHCLTAFLISEFRTLRAAAAAIPHSLQSAWFILLPPGILHKFYFFQVFTFCQTNLSSAQAAGIPA
jgi:hypothetical protein